MRGLDIARIHLFFSFEVGDESFSCALVHRFCKSFDDPDPDNGMWIVEPDFDRNMYRVMSLSCARTGRLAVSLKLARFVGETGRILIADTFDVLTLTGVNVKKKKKKSLRTRFSGTAVSGNLWRPFTRYGPGACSQGLTSPYNLVRNPQLSM